MTREQTHGARVVQLQLHRNESVRAHEREGALSAYEAHPEYPLERLCVHLYDPFQMKFARHAEQLLKVACEIETEIGDRGLTLRGETESELELAATILRNFYGSQIRVGPLTVRYHRGSAVEEPFMGVRVRCDVEWLEAVKADLIARGATIVSSELVRAVAFVRAVGPLARLIGYAKALASLAGPDARQLMWLSHYAPVQRQETGQDTGEPYCSHEEGTQTPSAAPRYGGVFDDDISPTAISSARVVAQATQSARAASSWRGSPQPCVD